MKSRSTALVRANERTTQNNAGKPKPNCRAIAMVALAISSFSCLSPAEAALINNGAFETGDLSGWQAVNAETPGSSYGVEQFDVDGDGTSSYAFWTLPETSGDTLRFATQLYLRQGLVYQLQVPIAESNTALSTNWGVSDVKARIGTKQVASFSFHDQIGNIPGNTVFRHTLEGEFTPLSTGFYTFELTFQRPFLEYTPIRAWVDDVQLSVPEPASGMLALGASIVGILTRPGRSFRTSNRTRPFQDSERIKGLGSLKGR